MEKATTVTALWNLLILDGFTIFLNLELYVSDIPEVTDNIKEVAEMAPKKILGLEMKWNLKSFFCFYRILNGEFLNDRF